MSDWGVGWNAAMIKLCTLPGTTREEVDAIKAGILRLAEPTTCGATAVFWPDVEACEAECALPPHDGTIHEDLHLGEWSEDELYTSKP